MCWGYWGAPLGGLWWLMPLFGFLFMAAMMFLCFRGLGRWSWWPRRSGWMGHARALDPEVSELRREIATLRDELHKVREQR